MRSSTSFVILAMGTMGCGTFATGESRGVTRGECSGAVAVVFTNASPDKMCGLHMSYDDNGKFGDNWLPAEGLPTGKSIEFKVKPGRYKATWNTCKTTGDKPYYAATLTQETGFVVNEATQLFAYVASTVAPTSRAAPRDFHKMVKFAGQEIGPIGSQTSTQVAKRSPAVPVEPTITEEPKQQRVDMSAFIDHKAAKTSTSTANKRKKPKASLKRAHDISSARVGYVERKR